MNFLTLFLFDSMKALLLDTSFSSNCPDVPPLHIIVPVLILTHSLSLSLCQFADTLPVTLGAHATSFCWTASMFIIFLSKCLSPHRLIHSQYSWGHSIVRVPCDRYRADLQRVLNLALMWQIFQESFRAFFFLVLRVVATRAWKICFFIYVVT